MQISTHSSILFNISTEIQVWHAFLSPKALILELIPDVDGYLTWSSTAWYIFIEKPFTRYDICGGPYWQWLEKDVISIRYFPFTLISLRYVDDFAKFQAFWRTYKSHLAGGTKGHSIDATKVNEISNMNKQT